MASPKIDTTEKAKEKIVDNLLVLHTKICNEGDVYSIMDFTKYLFKLLEKRGKNSNILSRKAIYADRSLRQWQNPKKRNQEAMRELLQRAPGNVGSIKRTIKKAARRGGGG